MVNRSNAKTTVRRLFNWRIDHFLLVLVLLVTSASAQAPQAGVLMDEFGTYLNCEDVLSRADGLSGVLDSKPDKAGLILVLGSGDKDSRARRLAALIHRALIGRLGLSRYYRIIGIDTPRDHRIQFWIVSRTDYNYPAGELLFSVPLKITKRYYFGYMSMDPCTNHIGNGFASALKTDQNYVGQIVIYNVPKNRRAETADGWFRYFRTEHGLDRPRIRVFFKKGEFESFLNDYHTEFWIMPLNTN